MKLVADWRRVVLLSLSFWMQVAGLLVMILPELWFHWTGEDYNPFVAWWLGLGFLVAGLAGRLLQQGLSPLREWIRVAAVASIVAAMAVLLAAQAHAEPASQAETLGIAVPFIAGEEGERLSAYIPVKGDVPTICFGETNGIRMGMRRTHEQCVAMLRAAVARYRENLHRYFTSATVENRLPATRDAAYTSTAYNCGAASIGRSTATRRLNAGNVVGGCNALTWWDKAGNRVLRGLYARRKREEALCLIGAR